jgi:hypothetical protein
MLQKILKHPNISIFSMLISKIQAEKNIFLRALVIDYNIAINIKKTNILKISLVFFMFIDTHCHPYLSKTRTPDELYDNMIKT